MRIGMSIPVRDLQDDHEGMARFAREADELGFTHLRVPDRVAAVGVDHAHEPLTLLAWVAAHTETIELVPSVIVLPTRQTVVVAKQAAEIDRLSGGRLRFGVGVGARAEDYAAFGQDFHTRGRRCDEQIDDPATAVDGGGGALRGALGPARRRAHQPASGAAAHPHLDRWSARAGRRRC